MANWDNLATKKLEQEMQVRWWDGVLDGYSEGERTYPDFYNKPFLHFSPYQRGYAYGQMMWMQENGYMDTHTLAKSET